MQHLRDLRQYVTDLASIPRLSREEIRRLTSLLAVARQGTLSPEQAAHVKQQLIEGHLWLAVALAKRSSARLRSLSPLDLVQQSSEQERLTAACAELEAEGIPVTRARLCSRAHVGSRAAAAFLRDYHPVVRPKQRPAAKVKPARPAKASQEERLATAFAHLVARGEKITTVRLRQEAGVSTDAAGAFLREQRTGGAHADLH